jgi:lysophospholipase L1-like esterase
VGGLLLSMPPAAWAQAVAEAPARFKAEIDAFVQWDHKNAVPDHPILFVGSSTIRMWPTHDRFPALPVINRGFGGSQIPDVNEYVQETTLKYRADTIVFYAGDNDINAGRTPAQVLADYRTFVDRVLAAKADTRIIFIAIKPSLARWALWSKMQEANTLVERYSATNPHLRYLDLSPQMLGADGRPRPELLLQDGLHMTPAGYDIWTAAVATALAAK